MQEGNGFRYMIFRSSPKPCIRLGLLPPPHTWKVARSTTRRVTTRKVFSSFLGIINLESQRETQKGVYELPFVGIKDPHGSRN
jgi:hypothetical protein